MEEKFKEAFNHLPSVDSEHKIHLERYIKFIESRPKRIYKANSGLCRHHVWPKSFGAYKNYIKEPWNIIILTEREHYIAHLILWKTFEKSMTRAFFIMNNGENATTGKYKNITSRQYERLRNDLIKNKQEYELTEQCRMAHKKQGKSLSLKFKNDIEYRNKRIELNNITTKSEDIIIKMNEGRQRYYNTEEGKLYRLRQGKLSSERKWMNNGIETTLVHKNDQEEYLAKGWVFGRINQKPTTLGKIKVNNGVETINILKEDLQKYLDMGYRKGVPPFSKEHFKNMGKSQKGKICINNGNKNIYIKKEDLNDYINMGYTRGMIRK